MSRHAGQQSGRRSAPQGPSQRQLRAGELIRHALVEILREEEIHDEDLAGVSVTVSEVRLSPDLKHATAYVQPLGAGSSVEEWRPVTEALNRHARFLRGQLGRHIDMKFTPDLRFRHDESFDEASRIERLFDDPRVRQDLDHEDTED
ncbi:30S ribosome-binding factor RbfA [Brevundimonas sp. 2R-24]|uniref:Ribosome-binding factor A n=1 Tax=Peiella sedimenti TaxID=3061083 RepID=A0ABT8SKR8_9CAUL|nr:30S ribosome-binding factor RbfA [Caulobacteraceae bacterium XZ-24]